MWNPFKKSPKNLFPEVEHVIEEVFTVGGVTYYQMTDTFNAPYERALKAIVFHREIDMNCDFEFLDQHTKAVDQVLMGKTINVFEIKRLNDLMKQRIALPKDEELLWKLASIVYFDKNENPAVYDYEYNKKKIEFWKKEAGTKAFFSQRPIQELMPYLKPHEQNLDTYFQMIAEFKKKHTAEVSAITSPKPSMN